MEELFSNPREASKFLQVSSPFKKDERKDSVAIRSYDSEYGSLLKRIAQSFGHSRIFGSVQHGDCYCLTIARIVVTENLWGITPPPGGIEMKSCQFVGQEWSLAGVFLTEISTGRVMKVSMTIKPNTYAFSIYRGYLLSHTNSGIFVVTMERGVIVCEKVHLEEEIDPDLDPDERHSQADSLLDDVSYPPTIIYRRLSGRSRISRLGEIRMVDKKLKAEVLFSTTLHLSCYDNPGRMALDNSGKIYVTGLDLKKRLNSLVILSPVFETLAQLNFLNKEQALLCQSEEGGITFSHREDDKCYKFVARCDWRD